MGKPIKFGWDSDGKDRYLHFSGARILRQGNTWTAKFVDEQSFSGHLTAEAAIRYIEAKDLRFWTVDGWTTAEWSFGVLFESAYVDCHRKFEAFAMSIKQESEVEPEVERIFTKYLLPTATCARCFLQMKTIGFKPIPYFRSDMGSSGVDQRRSFLLCDYCKSPLWCGNDLRISVKLSNVLRNRIKHARTRDVEGIYSASDIENLLASQNGKCFYCGVLFSSDSPHTVDHVVPIATGGTHWPENLCLACRPCNSKKCDKDILRFVASLKPNHRKVALQNIRARFPHMIESERPIRTP